MGRGNKAGSHARLSRLIDNLVSGVGVPLFIREDEGQEPPRCDGLAHGGCRVVHIKASNDQLLDWINGKEALKTAITTSLGRMASP